MNINWKMAGAVGAGVAGLAVLSYGVYSYFKATPEAPLIEGKIDIDDIDRRDSSVVGHGYRVVGGRKKEFVFSFLEVGNYSILKLTYLGNDSSNVVSIDETAYFTNLIGFPGQYRPEPTDQGFILHHVAV